MKDGAKNLVGEAAVKDDICLEHHRKTKGGLLFLGVVLSLLFFGCGENKYAQCEQIFQIVGRVSQNGNSVSYFNDGQPEKMKRWLEAASMLEQAANQLQALHINDSKLIEYQHKLVTVYRVYSQATYNAVKARENQNFPALKSAREDAKQAGQMQQDSIQQINAYCTNL